MRNKNFFKEFRKKKYELLIVKSYYAFISPLCQTLPIGTFYQLRQVPTFLAVRVDLTSDLKFQR